jgi:hypothetical protein
MLHLQTGNNANAFLLNNELHGKGKILKINNFFSCLRTANMLFSLMLNFTFGVAQFGIM